jgi:TonB family protein
MLAAGVGGMVILSATIDKTGHVVDLDVVRSTPGFEEAAIKAVSKWEYTPTLMNGEPIPVVMSVVVTFNLGRPGAPVQRRARRPRSGPGRPAAVNLDQAGREDAQDHAAKGRPSETATYGSMGKAARTASASEARSMGTTPTSVSGKATRSSPRSPIVDRRDRVKVPKLFQSTRTRW